MMTPFTVCILSWLFLHCLPAGESKAVQAEAGHVAKRSIDSIESMLLARKAESAKHAPQGNHLTGVPRKRYLDSIDSEMLKRISANLPQKRYLETVNRNLIKRYLDSVDGGFLKRADEKQDVGGNGLEAAEGLLYAQPARKRYLDSIDGGFMKRMEADDVDAKNAKVGKAGVVYGRQLDELFDPQINPPDEDRRTQ